MQNMHMTNERFSRQVLISLLKCSVEIGHLVSNSALVVKNINYQYWYHIFLFRLVIPPQA